MGGRRTTQSSQHGLCDVNSLLSPQGPTGPARAGGPSGEVDYPDEFSISGEVDGVENHSQKFLGESNDLFPRKPTLTRQSNCWI